MHSKEKQLNLGICSQLVYLPIHGKNNQTTDHKTHEGKDVSRTAGIYLSGVNHLKPISFPPETQQQTLFVGKKVVISCLDFKNVFHNCFTRQSQKQHGKTRMRRNCPLRPVHRCPASCSQRAVTNGYLCNCKRILSGLLWDLCWDRV